VSTEAPYFLGAVVVGLGATLLMDVWALLLKRAFNIPLANYCLVGRWLCHMPEGRFMHASIAAAPQKRSECAVGWIAHYVIGAMYALVLVALVSGSWLARPTLLPAVLFGIGSVLAPYLIMQPSFGLGIAASRTPRPTQARLRSLMAHTAFGVGLYVCAVGVSYVLRVYA
jgi:cytochrome b561